MRSQQLFIAFPKTIKHSLIIFGLTCTSLVSILVLVMNLGTINTNNSNLSNAIPKMKLSSSTCISADYNPSLTFTHSLTMYLPFVTRSVAPCCGKPIWVHSTPPASHQRVVLFRRFFSLDAPLQKATLNIFADTRYEVWIDGLWVGRGPARFSQTTREYDIYHLTELQPGNHLVAVLVQWAPNNRRSESTSPFLQSCLRGVVNGISQVVVCTDSQWKAILTNAWNEDAALVHSWGLIGPTELLDLRRIPENWMQPSYIDSEWQMAVVKDLPNVANQPRSIPLLTNVPFTPTVTEIGALSPGRIIGELTQPISEPFIFKFNVLTPTVFKIEMLAKSQEELTERILLDGDTLLWKKSGIQRPGVYTACMPTPVGMHALSFSGIPPEGLTFSIYTQSIQLATVPFQQGTNAGRRLLLSEPVRSNEQVAVNTNNGLDIKFKTVPAYVVLDLGRTIHGRLTAKVNGPSGTVVDIGWDERLWMNFRPLPYPGSLHKQWNQTDSWVLDGTPRSISTIDTRAGRYILLAVWGKSPVQFDNINVYEERYPVTKRGAFRSSNPRLDRIWQVGVDTLYPNMNDAYTDTPWRERGQWWGDAYAEDLVNRVAFGDTELLKRGLIFMSQAFQDGRPNALAPNGEGVHMLDYGMLWVQSLNDYWRLTDDTRLLADLYSSLYDLMTYLHRYKDPATGLLDIPFQHWSQTVLIDWAGYSSRYGKSTAVNALYYDTLLNAASIAETLGHSSIASTWRTEASMIKDQVNNNLYIPSQGRYLSSIFDGAQVPPSPQAQAWALAYGLVPESQVNATVSSLLELLSSNPASPNVEIYGMFWVLKALGEANRIPAGIQIIENYYGHMLDLGATTWWEGFNSNLSYTASLSHGWGGTPTWFLTTYVMGTRKLGPNTWVLRPAFNSVKYASGALPLQDGELEVHWERQNCQDRTITLISPISATGNVIIPFINATTIITMNNDLIWKDEQALTDNVTELDDGIHVSLDGGSYTLQIHQNCHAIYLPVIFQ